MVMTLYATSGRKSTPGIILFLSQRVCVCKASEKTKEKNKRRFPRNPASEPGALLQSGSGGPCEGLPGPAHGTKVVDFLVPLHVCVCVCVRTTPVLL